VEWRDLKQRSQSLLRECGGDGADGKMIAASTP